MGRTGGDDRIQLRMMVSTRTNEWARVTAAARLMVRGSWGQGGRVRVATLSWGCEVEARGVGSVSVCGQRG